MGPALAIFRSGWTFSPPMKILRDVREVTKLLILLEITRSQYTRLRPLTVKLDLTVQAVSEYMKTMRAEGLVHQVGGVYRATKRGVDYLHSRISQIRDFVDSSMRDLRIIDVASALAGRDIEEGGQVGLVMEGGRLVAYPHRSASSRGRALHAAREGEDVAVRDLEGIVELKPGRLVVLRLPAAQAGGGRGVDPSRVKERMGAFKPDLVAATDPVAVAFAARMAWPIDLEFAPVEAAIDATLRGLNVLLIAASPQFEEAMKAVEAVNAGLEDPVPSKVLNFDRG